MQHNRQQKVIWKFYYLETDQGEFQKIYIDSEKVKKSEESDRYLSPLWSRTKQ